MIHPSYFELMDLVNKDVQPDETPIVESRYSIVLGTAKRARQVIEARHAYDLLAAQAEKNGGVREQVVAHTDVENKPLSIAVEELREGKIHIIRSQEDTAQNEEIAPEIEVETAEADSQGAAEAQDEE